MRKLLIATIFCVYASMLAIASDEMEGEKCYCLIKDESGIREGDCNEYIILPVGTCQDMHGSLVKGQKPAN